MTGSYNETLSTTFSKQVRDSIQEIKADEDRIVYSDIFPYTKIKYGDSAVNLWSLEGNNNKNYLATSPTGTATGFGADILVIDDVLKNAEDANNANVLEKHWNWFCFEEETNISTSKGYKKIKDICIGDKVLTYNHSKCIIEEKKVIRTNNKKSSIYRLEFENGEKIETTGNHKFYTNKGYKSIEEILSIMRERIEPGQTILFERMFKQSKDEKIAESEMFKLSKRNRYGESKQTEKILFYGLQKKICDKKFKVKICSMGQIKGRDETKIQKMSKMWRNKKITCSSYRPRYKKQRYRKFDGTMPIMPYKISQIERLSSNNIKTVYDIEVEDNHNFFANNMLVHNCNTMISRLQGKRKVIIIMTRWATKDLAGKAISHFKEIGQEVELLSMKAFDGTKMLCDDVLSLEEYKTLEKTIGEDILSANYNQEPIDLKGVLYSNLNTYDSIEDIEIKSINNYTDTADAGKDYLCSITYAVDKDKNAYILDVIYTQAPMEITEPLLARTLLELRVNYSDIESNNGGRGFARNVQRITKGLGNRHTIVRPFTQTKNKESRIITNATGVMNSIYFPSDWKYKYPEFYTDVTTYQRTGKNKHDDAQDCLTGVYEKMQSNNIMRTNARL